MGTEVFNYIADGQMTMFDFLNTLNTPKIENSLPNIHSPRFTKKTCAANLKECDCYCGTDSDTNKCCSSCTEKCVHRCEYSLLRYEVFDKNSREWVSNPDYYYYIWELIEHGTGFQNGKTRVREYFSQPHKLDEKIAFLKKEYGEGGFDFPHKDKKNFVHGSMSSAKGIKCEYLDSDGVNHEELIMWSKIAMEIAFLVGKSWY